VPCTDDALAAHQLASRSPGRVESCPDHHRHRGMDRPVSSLSAMYSAPRWMATSLNGRGHLRVSLDSQVRSYPVTETTGQREWATSQSQMGTTVGRHGLGGAIRVTAWRSTERREMSEGSPSATHFVPSGRLPTQAAVDHAAAIVDWMTGVCLDF